ncbi:hypothetical protein SK803_39635 [Lentzea sp. BCCO 10_0856]|uniref:Uncharacterized protein n=1 Tax=Lentzea miocenica TaxID=3095431 RepID=A0ABU4TEN6_9PSEU|nr:hypothetical protein [Lentzea sp. BCCO 10_0856]MDX8036342.1 hypothetical protein [Lentzea sp. BCCO 10_0856]
MNVFGQVWLWSLLSFVAGALLTWLVMVRPARQRVAELEDQLLDARRSAPPIATQLRDDDFEVDEWDDAPPRSLSDEMLAPPAPAPTPAPAPAPYVEPPAYFGEPVPTPSLAPLPVIEQPAPEPEPEPVAAPAEAEYDEEPAAQVRQYMEPDESQRRFEEQLAEQRALADAEDDRPRSLFERLAPGDVPPESPAEQTTVLPLSGLEAADFDDEPELPAEQTSYVPTVVEPTAEVAPPTPEPTAGPEIDEQADDFIYQPREVWANEEQEAFLDEAGEQEDEPAGTRSEQTTFIAVEESSWPAGDLTGEFPGMRDELSGHLDGFVEPETPAEQTGLIEPIDLDAPHVRNGVFETTLAEEQAFTEPEPEQEAAHAYREPVEAEPVEHQEAEPVFEEFVEPEVGYAEEFTNGGAPAPFMDAGAPAPAPFSAFGAPAEVEEIPERRPNGVGAAFSQAVEAPAEVAPAPVADHPRSLFEPLLDADEPLPALGQTRTLPEPTNDQPFVPTFVPSDEPLLAAPPEPEPEPETDLPQRITEAGLPVREARRTTQQRQQTFSAFAAFDSPKQEAPPAPAPAAALPSRPRPVGFSPSTGGRPNGTPAGPSSRFQQPEGFNPRSPFGPGSVLPKSDGLAPAADFSVKATLTGRRYYTEGSANFGETRADVWFRTESDAEKAGFRPAP